MALTLTEVSRDLRGHRREAIIDFTFDASYAAGGEPLTAEMLGLNQVEQVDVIESPDGYFFTYDRATEKLIAFRQGGTASSGLVVELIDGQNGSQSATYTTAKGGGVGDEVVFVGLLSTKAAIATLEDVTADFSFTDTNELTDSGATDYTNDQLLVIYYTPSAATGSLVEVAAGTNLSTVNGRLVARGW